MKGCCIYCSRKMKKYSKVKVDDDLEGDSDDENENEACP